MVIKIKTFEVIPKISKAVLHAFLSFLSFSMCAMPAKNDSLRFEILLSSKMLNEIHLDVNLINSVGITSNRLILLSTHDQFYVLGWGGIIPLGKRSRAI